MELLCEENIQAATVVSLVVLTILSVLVILMYRSMRQIVKEINVDKSLHAKLDENDKTIHNLMDQRAILMKENLYIIAQRNDLAIKLDQTKKL